MSYKKKKSQVAVDFSRPCDDFLNLENDSGEADIDSPKQINRNITDNLNLSKLTSHRSSGVSKAAK